MKQENMVKKNRKVMSIKFKKEINYKKKQNKTKPSFPRGEVEDKRRKCA